MGINITNMKLNLRRPNGQLTEEQKIIKTNVMENHVNFLFGRAGTSKSHLAVNVGLDLLAKRLHYDKLIICRPPIEAGMSMGFLPGGLDPLEGKVAPYAKPILTLVEKMTDSMTVKAMLEHGVLEVVPPQLVRGWTFENAVVIIDEGQNLDLNQFKLIVSRLGKTSKLIFTMDYDQIDLIPPNHSCIHSIENLRDMEGIFIATLTENFRHPLALKIIDAVTPPPQTITIDWNTTTCNPFTPNTDITYF